jgi:transposase
MRSYSIDLRQKIIDVRISEQVSIRGLAQRFCVAKSFVQKIIKQFQEHGDIHPRQRGGGPPAKVRDNDLLILKEIIDDNNDATLKELCELLALKTGITVSTSTMHGLTKKMNYTVKKNPIRSRKK